MATNGDNATNIGDDYKQIEDDEDKHDNIT